MLRLSWVLLCVAAPVQDGARERLPVPEPAAQKEQEQLIRKIFKDEYAKTSPADKQALGKKLLQQAGETRDDPTTRFVLYRESRDLAAEGGDPETASAAVDQLAAQYKVSPFSMKFSAFSAAMKVARAPDDLRRLSAAFLKLSDDALAADELEVAAQSASRAASTARAAKDLPLAAKADGRTKELAVFKNRFEAVKKARELLATNPEDPAANSAMGDFLCIIKGDWAAGLPFLSKGSEGRLRELARIDLSGPSAALERLALADGWWELAERDKGGAQENLRRRAVHWYEQAQPGLSGIQKLKVSQRLSPQAPSWFATGLWAHWKMDDATGDVMTDSSGNRRDGKIAGATWVQGQLGGALRFDGDRQKVAINAGDLPTPWTAAMWVRREASPNATARITDTTGYQKGSSLRLEQSTGTRKVGITKHRIVDHPFEYSAPVDTWIHLAWVATTKTVTLYANGVVVGTLELTIELSLDYLGSQADQGLKGSLDDVRIYSRELSAVEVERLYQFGRR